MDTFTYLPHIVTVNIGDTMISMRKQYSFWFFSTKSTNVKQFDDNLTI